MQGICYCASLLCPALTGDDHDKLVDLACDKRNITAAETQYTQHSMVHVRPPQRLHSQPFSLLLVSQMPIEQVTISQIGAAQPAISRSLTHQLTVIDALMSYAQLTVSLRTGMRLVSQGQAAASQLLACLHQACCSPSSNANSSVVDGSCKQQPSPAESSSQVVPTVMKKQLQ
ncbi:hypothetical protein WJX77_012713 [Trebouxia sp. C0004]